MTEMTDYPVSFASNSIDIENVVLSPTPEAWADLNAENGRLNMNIESLRSQINRYANEQSEFESRLTEAVENGEIDNDLAKEFADIFGLELTKEYVITITGSWSGTVTVPLGESIEDLDIHIDYPEVGYSSNLEMDVDEDSIDWDVQENF